MTTKFDPKILKDLYKPPPASDGEDNGQVTIIGGSKLFHGAPLLSLKVASRIVDMVFFSSPEPSVGKVANYIKAKLGSFIWVPWKEIDKYIQKSDAALLGPGFMRYKTEESHKGGDLSYCDEACRMSRLITKRLLLRHPYKKWVIDAGSLQTMYPEWIPKNSILTPNKKEYSMLFGKMDIAEASKEYSCIICLKGEITKVASPQEVVEISGGNAGLTKGGTGDVHAGLTVALLAKNEPFLAAQAAAYIIKKTAENLAESVGVYFNADDLADDVPKTLARLG